MAASVYDCLVIGAGPAGTAAATLLAQAGRRVLIVDKAPFPRFHIGESLIPAANRVLRKMGVWDEVERAGFVRKEGAEFTFGTGEKRVHNRFEDGWVPGLDYTYQVERSQFDRLLLARAREAGCEVLQPAEARTLTQTDTGWQVELDVDGSPRTVEASWLLDAAGRGRWLGRQLSVPTEPLPLHKRFTVYGHFTGVARAEGPEGGNVILTRIPKGWFWMIPLDEERTSVGLVAQHEGERATPERIFDRRVATNPYMRACMAEAKLEDRFRVESDYSFVHQHFAGDRWLMLGDAAGFIDPVFSSGVYLALESADLAATAILKAGNSLGRHARNRYERQVWARMKVMLEMVQMYYDDRSFAVFMHPTDSFRLFSAVNAVVGGNTQMSFGLRWRYLLFLLVCRLNRHLPMVPPVKL
ncbi:tryptophan 7-halogenase [Ruficoccus sp. ZRK36]|uniref:NAD(P)/FAD-dependent oxidoreductase n=1 Tax=Ruficoccus sp. ZRK36 TaxID=2866311 RepID=UPI001C73832C|nr:tryptophan 7-halogenase [Ruficoccus sp. ZRK36]QYY36232.1 tryptophan 7-halogenase [Ruficoccus sp. ZRK36]